MRVSSFRLQIYFRWKPKSKAQQCEPVSLNWAKWKTAMFSGTFVSWWWFFRLDRWEKWAPEQGLWAYLEDYCHCEEVVSKHYKLSQLPSCKAYQVTYSKRNCSCWRSQLSRGPNCLEAHCLEQGEPVNKWNHPAKQRRARSLSGADVHKQLDTKNSEKD